MSVFALNELTKVRDAATILVDSGKLTPDERTTVRQILWRANKAIDAIVSRPPVAEKSASRR